MKKLLLLSTLALGCMTSTAFAFHGPYTNPLTCPFTHTFHINTDAPANTVILEGPASSSNKLTAQKLKNSESSFSDTLSQLGCNFPLYAVGVMYGTSYADACNMVIQESPSATMPSVAQPVGCIGNFTYTGITQDSSNSNSYTLHFTLKNGA